MAGAWFRGARRVKSGTVAFPDRPIRVARVIARLNIGGPAQHVTLLTAGLDRARFATTLITGVVGGREGDFTEAARARGVEPVVIPELGRAIRPSRDLVALYKLVRLFRRLRPEIVHTHTAKAGALGRLAARMAGVPVTVHTFHGHVLEGYFSPPATRIFLAIERWLARGTDRLVTVSPRLRVQLLAMGIGRPDQVEVVPLGLDLGRFRLGCGASAPALRASLGLAPGTPLLGSVGRLVPIKDHPTLFRAVAQLGAGGEGAHLVVVGDGEDRPALARLAQALGVSTRVHFLGWRADLETILSELDVVICSSRNEGTPVALIEAMAAGVAVLSTEVGGVADLVTHGETGWLVPPGDPSAMAEAIRHLLAEPKLRTRLAAAGRDVALDRHDVTRLIARIDRLYTGLINEKLTTGNGQSTK
jgi:glycosyltransferase involved in cell wall biosynthesis